MNYPPFDIGEPFQSRLIEAMKAREESTSSREKSRANCRIRSIRLEAARSKATHTSKQWGDLLSKLGYRCVMCGDHGILQKDHVIPIYQGGSDGIENLQPLCHQCNAAKGPDSTNWALYRIERGFGE